MNLMLSALLGRIDALAKEKGLQRYRVNYRRNARGEMVIALIVNDEPNGPLSRATLGE